MPIPVAIRSKALACNCLIPGIAVLYPVEVMDILLFRLLRGVSVAPSAMSLSLVQWDPTGCACLIVNYL